MRNITVPSVPISIKASAVELLQILLARDSVCLVCIKMTEVQLVACKKKKRENTMTVMATSVTCDQHKEHNIASSLLHLTEEAQYAL